MMKTQATKPGTQFYPNVAPLTTLSYPSNPEQSNGPFLASHPGLRPFACEQCGKGFTSRFKLVRHSLIHSSERRHKCPNCERGFRRKDHLKNHLQVHDPNKLVLKCPECAKAYTSRMSYRKHMAVHTAHKGHLECGLCGMGFANTDQVLYHLKVHAGARVTKNPSEKKFECDICERRFFTRKDVKRHLVVHTGKREFGCQFCPQRFGRKDHLVRHVRKGHCTGTTKEKDDRDGSSGSREVPRVQEEFKGKGPFEMDTVRGGWNRAGFHGALEQFGQVPLPQFRQAFQ